MNIVTDCIVRWEDMDGDSPLHKKINSLLTSTFIGRHGVPSDECSTHAEILVTFFHADDNWQELVRGYLVHHFASSPDGELLGDDMYRTCSIAVDRIEKLLKHGWWPDQPVVVN